jgi:hypothetical protein
MDAMKQILSRRNALVAADIQTLYRQLLAGYNKEYNYKIADDMVSTVAAEMATNYKNSVTEALYPRLIATLTIQVGFGIYSE